MGLLLDNTEKILVIENPNNPRLMICSISFFCVLFLNLVVDSPGVSIDRFWACFFGQAMRPALGGVVMMDGSLFPLKRGSRGVCVS